MSSTTTAEASTPEAPPRLSYDELLAKEKPGIFETRLRYAEQLREYSNEHYKAGQYDAAEAGYRQAIFFVEMDELQVQFELQDNHRLALFNQTVPALINLSQCLMRKHEYKEVITLTTKALSMDSSCGKALYLRGKANIAIKDYAQAKADLTLAETLVNDDLVKGALREAKTKGRAADREAGSTWRGVLKSAAPSTTSADNHSHDTAQTASSSNGHEQHTANTYSEQDSRQTPLQLALAHSLQSMKQWGVMLVLLAVVMGVTLLFKQDNGIHSAPEL